MIKHQGCRVEVVLHMMSGIMEGRTCQQLKADWMDEGVSVTEDEELMARWGVIKSLINDGEVFRRVANFCARAGHPIISDEVLALERALHAHA